ncbi:hypothetical protein L6R50_08865 [Myxococcota bacterium]|nr:hypothetical protein [Myxococcota bacterium]
MATWADSLEDWGTGWKALLADGLRRLRGAVERDPEAYRADANGAVEDLVVVRAQLDAMKMGLARLERDPEAHRKAVAQFNALHLRWWEMAVGLYAHAEQRERPAPARGEFGGVVVVLVVGALGLTVVALVWAHVARGYIAELRRETENEAKALDVQARALELNDQASREGRALPGANVVPGQLRERPADPSDGGSVLPWVLGGLAVVAGAAVVPALLKR